MNKTATGRDPRFRAKLIILVLGVFISFFTSMSKMLVPGPIYSQLQTELLFDPAQIASLGAFYMYAYATSQLLMGIYSDRYGGVRLLLIGGSLFSVGSCLFPLSSNLWWMNFFRVLTGLGAGTVFLGEAKLLNDLFPTKFAVMLGVVLMIGYFGPVMGTVPVVWLIAQIGWRWALFLPGGICLLATLGIVALARGTLQKAHTGQSLQPFRLMLQNRPMWVLCISSALIFGAYYVLLTQIGQKCVEDFYAVDKYWASLCITGLAIVVALNNVMFNWFLKLLGGNRKRLIQVGYAMSVVGSAIGCATFYWHWSVGWLLLSFLLIAFPAGFFSLYGGVGKDLNPPESTGLAVAVVNFSAFVFIALFGNISGVILSCWSSEGASQVLPGASYSALFLFLTLSGLVAAGLSWLLPNLDCPRRRK